MNYLIIGGTTKAATTSLFIYLSAHPQICASSMKETRFFLDDNYPLESKYRYEEGLEKYEEFFYHCPNNIQVRMEATPDYLYSSGTPLKIYNSLPKAKMIFILREPVSRLISWYKFALQRGLLSTQVTFDEYIDKQINKIDDHITDQHYLALRQGRYARYLQRFYKVFGDEHIFVIYFEDLLDDPYSVLKSVCQFCNLEPNIYSTYHFKKYNPTVNLRAPHLERIYNQIKYRIRIYTHNKPILHDPLKFLRSLMEPIYQFITKDNEPAHIAYSPKTIEMLHSYYKNEAGELRELTGEEPPW